MNTFLPVKAYENGSSLRIRGRVMAHTMFSKKLRKLCAALGLPVVLPGGDNAEAAADPSWKWAGQRNGVVLLSCRVPYNPQWGELGGQPQLFGRIDIGDDDESPAGFIAPFLRQYRLAQDHILLARSSAGEYRVTIPAAMLQAEGPGLRLHLRRIAALDESGRAVSLPSGGLNPTYALSAELSGELAAGNFALTGARQVPIGRYLVPRLFSFVEDGQAGQRQSPFHSTLFGHLGEIVTHRTPNLRATEIHLGQLFLSSVASLAAEYGGGNALCLAGLDIDMSAALGHREQHCFVPWRAYLIREGEAFFIEQDDLFVLLMQESA
jgi:hypothetical protein